jgi:hypothetical protein
MGLFRIRRLCNSGKYAAKAMPSKIAEASYLLASAHVMLGHFEKGIQELDGRCVPAFQDRKNGLMYGNALYTLGYALNAMGERKRCVEILLECRDVMKVAREPLEEGRVMNHLAQAFLDAGNNNMAESLAKEAKELLDSLKIDSKSSSATPLVRNSVVRSRLL